MRDRNENIGFGFGGEAWPPFLIRFFDAVNIPFSLIFNVADCFHITGQSKPVILKNNLKFNLKNNHPLWGRALRILLRAALTLRFIVHTVHVLLDMPRFVSILKFNHEVWSIISPLPIFVLEDVDRIGF